MASFSSPSELAAPLGSSLISGFLWSRKSLNIFLRCLTIVCWLEEWLWLGFYLGSYLGAFEDNYQFDSPLIRDERVFSEICWGISFSDSETLFNYFPLMLALTLNPRNWGSFKFVEQSESFFKFNYLPF